MLGTDLRSQQAEPPSRWPDSPRSCCASGNEIREWEMSLLLPQQVAALEHRPAAVDASAASHLSRIWRALRTTACNPLRKQE